MMKPSLIIAYTAPRLVIERARLHFDVTAPSSALMSVAECVAAAQEKNAAALLISTTHRLSKSDVDALPGSVRIVATSSVGHDHLPLAALKARGIFATNTPDVLTDCTADLTFLLILAASRRLSEYQSIMNAGWGRAYGQAEMLGQSLKGKNLGIFGMGRIGQAVAHRARSFGMNILYCNRRRLRADREAGAIYFEHFREMLPQSQVLTLLAPAGPATRHIMNVDAFAQLPAGSVFVNTSRGSLVDEEALIEALKGKKLFSAGLDVFENEPNVDPRLLELPNLVLTPHMGSATIETRTAMGYRALENISTAIVGNVPGDVLP
jgi:lactate dehydrogenase-like 2-hydroxyacid dehydrogenase